MEEEKGGGGKEGCRGGCGVWVLYCSPFSAPNRDSGQPEEQEKGKKVHCFSWVGLWGGLLEKEALPDFLRSSGESRKVLLGFHKK